MPRALRFAALVALTLWSVGGCAVEVGRELAEGAAELPQAFSRWRFDTPQADRLTAFATAVGERVPEGSVVAFATGGGRGEAEQFQSLWVAYTLPRQRVIRLSHPRAARQADFLAAYGPRVEHPRLGPPERLPGGWLYPVSPE